MFNTVLIIDFKQRIHGKGYKQTFLIKFGDYITGIKLVTSQHQEHSETNLLEQLR